MAIEHGTRYRLVTNYTPSSELARVLGQDMQRKQHKASAVLIHLQSIKYQLVASIPLPGAGLLHTDLVNQLSIHLRGIV